MGTPRKANRKRKEPPKPLTEEDLAARARLRQQQSEAMAGNQWWKARGRHGRLPTYPHGEEGAKALMENIEDYFQWSEDNTLKEDKAFSYEGDISHTELSKMSITTLTGLCVFLGIVRQTWYDWKRDRPDLSYVLEWAEHSLETNNVRGAAAGLLNPMIVARIHQLAERTEVSGPNGKPLQSETVTREMTPQEAAEAYARTREGRE